MDDMQERDEVERAVAAKLGFVRHVIVYVLVIAALFVINNLTFGGYQWWLWPAFGWGLGVAANLLSAFVIRPALSGAGSQGAGSGDTMKGRRGRLNITGAILGVVALGVTAFAAVSIFSSGAASLALSGRPAQIAEGLGRGLRAGLANRGVGGWQQAAGEETVSGAQTILTVTNVSGRVRITGWDQDEVRVRYVKQARTAADLEAFKIEVRGDGDGVTVRPLYEPAGLTPRFGSVELDISVPKRIARLTVHNVSGAIEVQGLAGKADQELVTVSGSIVTAAEGTLSARSTSGAIQLEFSGDSLGASTVSGRIGAVVRSLGTRGAELRTVSGSVEVQAYAGLDAAVDLRSVSGAISCDFPVDAREQSRGKLTGNVGSGSAPFTVSTTSGAIRIRKG
jgi:hypothetical protein